MADGVDRRAASPGGPSSCTRHRVRERWPVWRRIGASGSVLGWIRRGLKIPWRFGRRPPQFNHGESCRGLPQEQQRFLDGEVQRLINKGVFQKALSSRWVSRAFLVPKDDGTWRLVIDLRTINEYVQNKVMKMETLKRLRLIAKPGDWFISFDLRDGFYSLSIAPEDRECLAVNICGQILWLCALPQGFSLSPWAFQKLTDVFINYLRDPDSTESKSVEPKENKSNKSEKRVAKSNRPKENKPALRISSKAKRRAARRTRLRQVGARLLPFVDDFAMFETSPDLAVARRDSTFALLDSLGLEVHPSKGHHTPTQIGDHLGINLDFVEGVFRAPAGKLASLSRLATNLLCSAAANRRQVSAKALAALGGKAQFLYLAIPAARYYLRELHDVVATRRSWSSKVLLTKQLKRDLEWWRNVPAQSNGSPIWKPVETAYVHCDSSGYGWGGVLNQRLEARGFWMGDDRSQHITWKELKAVRRTVESFLPMLRGRRVVLHEDNQSVIGVLTGLTSRSPVMMTELRKLFCLLDSNGITLRPTYIRSAANVWADRLSRELDRDDWSLHPEIFKDLDRLWGPHSIDRFASKDNRQLPRYNSKWRDGTTEDVDSLHLPDSAWQLENSWCNPPWDLLDDLVVKLRQSGAAATVVAPRWPKRPWYLHLASMASESIVFPPTQDLFSRGRQPGHEGVGRPGWSIEVFRLPSRPGS